MDTRPRDNLTSILLTLMNVTIAEISIEERDAGHVDAARIFFFTAATLIWEFAETNIPYRCLHYRSFSMIGSWLPA